MSIRQLKIWVLFGSLLFAPCHKALSQCVVPNMLKGDFPKPDIPSAVRRPWFAEGKISIFDGKALSNHTAGWNALRQSVALDANRGYSLTAYLRTSRTMRDGYLGFRGVGLPKNVETKFGPKTEFTPVKVVFTPVRAGNYDVFVGFWALDKDAFLEVRDVQLQPLFGGCNDVVTNPAN